VSRLTRLVKSSSALALPPIPGPLLANPSRLIFWVVLMIAPMTIPTMEIVVQPDKDRTQHDTFLFQLYFLTDFLNLAQRARCAAPANALSAAFNLANSFSTRSHSLFNCFTNEDRFAMVLP